MADYSQDITSAYRDIADAGIMCKLRRGVSDDIDVPALITNVDPKVVDGELIMVTDTLAIIPGGLSRNPSSELDRLIIPACDIFPNGENLRIVKPTPTAPNGQAIIWELLCRK